MPIARIEVTKEDYALVKQLHDAAFSWLVGEMCVDTDDPIFIEADDLARRILTALAEAACQQH